MIRFGPPPAAVVHLDRAADERRALLDAAERGAHPGFVAHVRSMHAAHLRAARRSWSPGRALALIARSVAAAG